ncbi:uncharacterized protein LOC132641752 [Lycium barbarum]|uniref:uncharacterized protein LOC132641752 n=1 Tax=Lycium barbarum TaxID=112863 RepID=UPI00293F5420|nr:uncharacterized protein LOC132641752 [Lycium barbarum]
MGMGHERTKPLHNFTLPCGLKWGNQKHLRCAKLDGRSSSHSIRRPEINRRRSNGDGNGIAAVREKLMFDLQEETDKMKHAIFTDNQVPAPPPEDSRPWNLRTRRAACKAPMNGSKIPSPEILPSDSVRVPFSVSLGRKEIQEDFMTMVGHRPPRRPKKRAKLVQKNLDTLFPGLWLTEITPDLYKVADDQ